MVPQFWPILKEIDVVPLVVSRTVCTQTTPPLSIVQYDLIMGKGRVYAYIEVGGEGGEKNGGPWMALYLRSCTKWELKWK